MPVGYHHGNIHPSIPVLSLSFLYHPYIPIKRFFIYLSPSFILDAHYIINFYVTLGNLLLPISMPCYSGIVLYMYALPVIWTDCLRVVVVAYTVNNGLLVMCLLAFFVTSADKSQLWIYLCSLLIILPEAICCCLET